MARRNPIRARAWYPGVLAALIATGLSLSSCTSARNTLGTTSSVCYQALPQAAEAVHHQGRFLGIRLLPSSLLESPSHRRLRAFLSLRAGAEVREVCLAAYRGKFTPAGVERFLGAKPPGGAGSIAVVVVSRPGNRVLATFIFDHRPLRFAHSGIGGG